MFVVYENIAGLTSTLSASSKEGPYVSQVRKYSDAVEISEATLLVQGTFTGETRANYHVEITDLGSRVLPGDPGYRSNNFGRGFISRDPQNALCFVDGNTQHNIKTQVTTAGAGNEVDLWEMVPTAGSSMFFSQDYKFDKIAVGMCTPNVNGATLAVWYWDGSQWQSVSNLEDGTKSAGRSLYQDGLIEFDMPSDWVQDVLFATSETQYWLMLSWTAGLTGQLGLVDLKNRPETDGYDKEQTFTLECVTEAAGSSQAIFSLTGSLDGDLGQFECGQRHVLAGGSLAFTILEDSSFPWHSSTRARCVYDPFGTDPLILYSGPAVGAVQANELHIFTDGFPSPSTFVQQLWESTGRICPLPSEHPDCGMFARAVLKTSEIPTVYQDVAYMMRQADGSTQRTREHLIQMINSGYRWDHHEVEQVQTFSVPAALKFAEADRQPVGIYNGKLFQYSRLGSIVIYNLSDGTTAQGALDGNFNGYSKIAYCSAGQTLYMAGTTAPPRIWMYNMAADTFVEGSTNGYTDPFPDTDGPVMTYDPQSVVIYILGNKDSDEGRTVYRYDPVADGLSSMGIPAPTVNGAFGMFYHEPDGCVHIFKDSDPPIRMSMADGSTAVWADSYMDPEAKPPYKADPVACRAVSCNSNRSYKIFPTEEKAWRVFDYDIYYGGSPWDIGDGFAVDTHPDGGDELGQDDMFYILHCSDDGTVTVRRCGPWNRLQSAGSTWMMWDSADGGSWTTGERIYELSQLSTYSESKMEPFSGASEDGDRITFSTAYGVFFKWTDDYEAANPTYVENQPVEADAWIPVGGGLSIRFSHSLASYYNQGDYWRFFAGWRYRPENVYNWNQRETWRTTAGTSQALVIDLGEGNERACDAIAILNSNLTPVSTVRIQAGDGSSWDYPPLDHALTVGSDGRLLTRFENSASYRYWRLYMDDSALDFVEIGGLLIGKAVEFDYDPAPPFTVENSDGVILSETRYGQRGARWNFEREHWALRWPTITQEDYDRLVDLRRVVKDSRQPFVFGLAGQTRFVRWRGPLRREVRAEPDGSNRLYQSVEVRFEEEIS